MALDAVPPALTVRHARTRLPRRTHSSRSRRARLAISHLRPADEPGEKCMAIRRPSRRDAGGLPAFCSGDTPAERVPVIARNMRSSTSPCTSGRPTDARGARGLEAGARAGREDGHAGHGRPRLEAPRAPRKHCAKVAHDARPIGHHGRPEQTPTCAAVRRPEADKEEPRVPGGVREVSGRPSRHRLLWWNCTRGRGLLTADNCGVFRRVPVL